MAEDTDASKENAEETEAKAAKSADADEAKADDAGEAKADDAGEAKAADGDEAKADAPTAEAKPKPKATAKKKPAPKDVVVASPAKAEGGKSSSTVILVPLGLALVMALGFAFLRQNEQPAGAADAPGKAPFNVGQSVDVQVTLVAADQENLSCAAAGEVAGKHCAFEAKDKPWSKGDDPKTVLQPFTTTDKRTLLATGMFSEPPLNDKTKLPADRFSVKCKFNVEGKLGKTQVRWNKTANWRNVNEELPVGTLTGCTVVKK